MPVGQWHETYAVHSGTRGPPGARPPSRPGPRHSILFGLSPIYKFLCLKNLQKNLPQFIGSHAAIRTNPERQALVFQPSAHPCSYRHVLVHKAEGPPWPSTCCYQTGCAIGDSPTTIGPILL